MRTTVLAVTLVVLVGCETTNRPGSADIQLIDDAGKTKDWVDFGSVQVGMVAREKVRIRNPGSATLQLGLQSVLISDSHFKAELPAALTLKASEDGEFALTFTPTDATLTVTGQATVLENPHGASATLRLSGVGIASVIVASPSTLDFGEVYAGESKTVELTLTNVGSRALSVLDAGVVPAAPEVTGPFASLVGSLGQGKQMKANVVYAPMAAGQLNQALWLALGDGLPTFRVPLAGRAIQALPRACFRSAETGVERCTNTTDPFLTIDFASVCDRARFPPDGGGCRGSDGGLASYSRSGSLYFRNEGTTPVSYAVAYNAQASSVCDAGSALDFAFSNAPATPKWTEATTALPMQSSDPKPWETSPISVTYKASSACAADTVDRAHVVWLRQGEGSGSRAPTSLDVSFVGRSMHPAGEPSDLTLSGSTPTTVSFGGVLNRGDAPLRLTSVALWHGELADGGQASAPVAPCSVPPTGVCRFFAWESGWAPADALPVTLEGTARADAPTSAVLGKLIFGPLDAGVAPEQNAEYQVFAVIQTDDPYAPQGVSTIRGRKTQ